MLVPASSSIFFLREHRFAVRCRVVTLRQLLWTLFTLLFMLSACLLHIFLYIFFINIGCATLYYLSMMYVTVYVMSFNSNCCILAAEQNYRFTKNLKLMKFNEFCLYREKRNRPPWLCRYQTYISKWYINRKVFTSISVLPH